MKGSSEACLWRVVTEETGLRAAIIVAIDEHVIISATRCIATQLEHWILCPMIETGCDTDLNLTQLNSALDIASAW